MNKPGASIPIPGRYVGRVGALAVALGVGSAIGAVPLAGADTTDSSEGPGISDTAAPLAATATGTRETERHPAPGEKGPHQAATGEQRPNEAATRKQGSNQRNHRKPQTLFRGGSPVARKPGI